MIIIILYALNSLAHAYVGHIYYENGEWFKCAVVTLGSLLWAAMTADEISKREKRK